MALREGSGVTSEAYELLFVGLDSFEPVGKPWRHGYIQPAERIGHPESVLHAERQDSLASQSALS